MENKKILSEDELMLEYSEMSSFDFDSTYFRQIQDLHNEEEYDYITRQIPFKYGNFDLVDLFHELASQND